MSAWHYSADRRHSRRPLWKHANVFVTTAVYRVTRQEIMKSKTWRLVNSSVCYCSVDQGGQTIWLAARSGFWNVPEGPEQRQMDGVFSWTISQEEKYIVGRHVRFCQLKITQSKVTLKCAFTAFSLKHWKMIKYSYYTLIEPLWAQQTRVKS